MLKPLDPLDFFDFLNLSFLDILDILLVALLLYYVYKLVKGTVAINIFIGIIIIYLIWKLTEFLKMEMLSNIFGGFMSVGIIALIIVFQQIQNLFPFNLSPDTSSQDAVSKFGDLKGNWIHFFTIIPFILLQSALEELLDRGFLINWFERLFSKTSFATSIAVVLQAMIFGFRHSYDISERSITVGIIGLVMGIAYVKFGRNLWPLIIAHCILNTMSMIEKI